MNRQIRRDQERKQEKQDKEKDKRRSDRRKRREQAQADRERRRKQKKEGGGGEAPKRTDGRRPGRFSGVLAAATVFFILLQALVPADDMTVLNTIVSAGFYLLFGYFFTLWLLRRGTERAVQLAVISGAMLGVGAELGKFLRPELTFDPLLAVMILPAVVIGTLLGRLVYFNAPG